MVPQDVFKTDDTVRNAADLTLLLSTLRYWLVERMPHSRYFAVQHNMVSSLLFCCENCAVTRERVCSIAAQSGSLDCLRYLHETVGCEWLSSVCILAALSGHLDCLTYAHEHGCPGHDNTAVTATVNDQFGILQHVHGHGGTVNDLVAMAAAFSNHINCLQYALDHGCPVQPHTAAVAAGKGHLECLQCLHEHGCEWGIATPFCAVLGDQLGCLLRGEHWDTRCS